MLARAAGVRAVGVNSGFEVVVVDGASIGALESTRVVERSTGVLVPSMRGAMARSSE
jgi:hypothetical protein